MREILFRGKRKDIGKWINGFLVDENLIGDWVEAEPVYPETVGQFTGLTDKNGTRIYEGDVVLYPWNYQDKTERFTIKFKDGQFVASPIKKTEDYWDFMVGGYSKEMEIIGSIHDNPELLEVHND